MFLFLNHFYCLEKIGFEGWFILVLIYWLASDVRSRSIRILQLYHFRCMHACTKVGQTNNDNLRHCKEECWGKQQELGENSLKQLQGEKSVNLVTPSQAIIETEALSFFVFVFY